MLYPERGTAWDPHRRKSGRSLHGSGPADRASLRPAAQQERSCAAARREKRKKGKLHMQFFNCMLFTALSFVGFTALVAIITWWKSRGDNLDTQDGYYLAGHGLTGPVIAGSLLMTNLSAEQ